MIVGERVEQAREYQRLTQRELADLIGVSQVFVTRLERSGAQGGEALISALGDALRFPRAFFERELSASVALGTLEFRARADTTARAKKRAHSYASLVFEFATGLSSRLKMPAMRLPTLHGDPESCAQLFRSELGIAPNAPIRNLTDALERAGVFVFALPNLDAGCDGFSAWGTTERALVPAIFVSASAPGDRQRLTIAHEVGELSLGDLPPGRDRERSANRFAGAVLLPPDALRRELVHPVTLHDFVEVKKRFGISVQASLVRANQLGIITAARYHTLYKQISIQKWRKQEPIEIAREKPRALTKMAEVLYGEQIDVVTLAADAALDPLFVRQLLAVHATKADLRTKTTQRARGDVVPFRRPSAQAIDRRETPYEEVEA